MKYLLTLSLLLLVSSLAAQDVARRALLDFFYLEGQVGGSYSLHPEFVIKSNYARGLSAGIRFHQRHAIGVAQSFFAKSVGGGYGGYNYAYGNLGLRYRFEAGERWQFYAGAGAVDRFRVTRLVLTFCDEVFHEVNQQASQRFYVETGLRFRLGGPLYVGCSMVGSGDIAIMSVSCDPLDSNIKQEYQTLERGIRLLTFDLALVFQTRKR